MASRNRGKPKQKVTDISREVPTRDELTKISHQIGQAPPIMAAILGAGIIEYELEYLLRRRMALNDDDTWKRLTGFDGPISSFFQKILLGHALGLYDEDFMEHLHIIRTIRNQFAHAKKVISFEHPLIVQELQTIRPYGGKKSTVWRDLEHCRRVASAMPQHSYTMLCRCLSLHVRARTLRQDQANLRRKEKRLFKLSQRVQAAQAKSQAAEAKLADAQSEDQKSQ